MALWLQVVKLLDPDPSSSRKKELEASLIKHMGAQPFGRPGTHLVKRNYLGLRIRRLLQK